MWLLLFVFLSLSIAKECRPLKGFYSDRERGWFWKEACEERKENRAKKEERKEEKREEGYKVLTKREVSIPWGIIDRLDPSEIARIEEESRKIAIMYPTMRNVLEYRKLLNYINSKSEKFAFQYFIAGKTTPAKEQSVVYQGVRTTLAEVRDRKTKEVFERYRSKAGLVVVVQRDCPYCKAFKEVLDMFVKESKWQVKEVDSSSNPVLVERLGTETVPDIFLVLLRNGKYEWQRIGSGYMTLDDLINSVLLGFYLLGEIKDESFITW